MPFDPPSSPSPTVGQPYEYEGRRYEFDGVIWRSKTNGVENFYWVIALSDLESNLTLGTKEFFRVERAFVMTALPRISVYFNPVGSAIIVNIEKGVTSIFQAGDELQIDTGTHRSAISTAPAVFNGSPPSFAAGDVISFDILQVGATSTGTGLKAHIFGRWTE